MRSYPQGVIHELPCVASRWNRFGPNHKLSNVRDNPSGQRNLFSAKQAQLFVVPLQTIHKTISSLFSLEFAALERLAKLFQLRAASMR